MIDIRLIRNELDLVRENIRRRGADVDVDRLADLDRTFRQLQTELNELQRQRNAMSGPDQREQAALLRERIAGVEERLREVQAERDELWARVPNLLAPDTPEGEDESDNVQVDCWGELPVFDFEPKTHDVVGQQFGILDFSRATKVAGAGFYYWKGDGARLAWALFTLANKFLFERGFTPLLTPIVAKQDTLFGTGYLPFFADQIYKLEGEDLCLIGTSEQTLVGYHRDEIIPADQLPLCYSAFSPCMRTEAGSYGRQSRGAFRVHQFHKVEQIIVCEPEQSEEWQQRCLKNETEFMQLLGLPYRVVRVCAGDLGAPGYKKFDVEGWFAGFGAYRETHSNTNLLDYQARRLNLRYKKGKSTVYPHTISATMITDRAALAILENNQQADGSVIIPEALRSLMGGQERIMVR